MFCRQLPPYPILADSLASSKSDLWSLLPQYSHLWGSLGQSQILPNLYSWQLPKCLINSRNSVYVCWINSPTSNSLCFYLLWSVNISFYSEPKTTGIPGTRDEEKLTSQYCTLLSYSAGFPSPSAASEYNKHPCLFYWPLIFHFAFRSGPGTADSTICCKMVKVDDHVESSLTKLEHCIWAGN